MEQLDRIEKMLTALLRQAGQLQVIDCWALGSNDGGRYVSLFNSKAQYRLCAVYEEQWGKLPAYVRDAIPNEEPGDISTERARVEKAKRLHTCPPFAITRWQLGSGDDQAKWRFGDVLWQSRVESSTLPTPERPQNDTKAAPAPPTFGNLAEAVKWAVQIGAFADYDAAKTEYDTLKETIRPANAGAMYAAWIGHVRTHRPA